MLTQSFITMPDNSSDIHTFGKCQNLETSKFRTMDVRSNTTNKQKQSARDVL